MLTKLILSVADDKLILGHRNSDWTGLGPILEEDIAFSSLAQDNIAHASALYDFAATLDDGQQSADQLAFGRSVKDYLCAQLLELPDEFDYATAIARQFLYSQFEVLRLQRLANSSDKPLADLAKRLHAEQNIQVEHATRWLDRLGTGDQESRQRMQQAIDQLSPFALGLFEPIENESALIDSGIYPESDEGNMFDTWQRTIEQHIKRASLSINIPERSEHQPGGRRGNHTEHLQPLLDEMTEVFRIEPSGKW